MYTQIKNNNQINQFNVPNIKLTTFNNQQPIKKFSKCSSYIFRLKQMYTQIKNNNQINQFNVSNINITKLISNNPSTNSKLEYQK